ncbi:MAG: calcium:proton antiporter [Devosia sp.]
MAATTQAPAPSGSHPTHGGQIPTRPTGLLALDVLVPAAALILGLILQLLNAELSHLPIFVELGLSAAIIAFVFWTVFIVLGHAEAIAHRIGEPFGTLVLTISVTAIEVSVIVSVMLHGDPNPTIARESVFSTVMIICAGVVGACLLLGGWRHRHQEYKRVGTGALLSVVIALAVLTLVLPNFTLAAPSGNFSAIQLIFVSLLCLLLYGSFVFAQMTSQREDFLDDVVPAHEEHDTARHSLGVSLVLLLVGLVGIVLLAEHVAAGLEAGLETLQLPQADAIVGAFIATLVLLPETVAAIRAAMRNELQRSLNIALGSACATIGLTVPVVSMISLATGHQLTLGLGPGDTVLLLLALGISIVSFGQGRTTVLTGLVHLVVFVAYLLLIAVP